MKLLLVLLTLALSAPAAVIEIRGVLDRGLNPEAFGEPLPVRYVLTAEFDPLETQDKKPSLTLGEYEFPTGRITFSFGNSVYIADGIEIQVFSGDGPDQFYGVTLGNLSTYSQNGQSLPEYFGNYGSLLGSAFQLGSFYPDDSLERVTQQALDAAQPSGYAYVRNTADDRIQGDIESVQISEVPELHPIALIGLGVCLLALVRRGTYQDRRG